MTRRLRQLAPALVAPTLMSGCDSLSGPGPSDGDCNTELVLDGVRYRVNSDLSDEVPLGPELGMADVVGCTTDAVLDRERVYRVRGVDPADAVAVVTTRKGKGRAKLVSIYVEEGFPQSEIPSGWPTLAHRP